MKCNQSSRLNLLASASFPFPFGFLLQNKILPGMEPPVPHPLIPSPQLSSQDLTALRASNAHCLQGDWQRRPMRVGLHFGLCRVCSSRISTETSCLSEWVEAWAGTTNKLKQGCCGACPHKKGAHLASGTWISISRKPGPWRTSTPQTKPAMLIGAAVRQTQCFPGYGQLGQGHGSGWSENVENTLSAT